MSDESSGAGRSGSTPWWAGGFAFECHRCGACCRGPGNVWISDAEIAALAQALEMREDELRAVYTRRAEPRARARQDPGPDTVLRQKGNHDCVFWEPGSGCGIYAHRPQQCRTYPFWRAIVHSRESWEQEARACAGIGCGPLHDRMEIGAMTADDGIPQHRTRQRVKRDVREAVGQGRTAGRGSDEGEDGAMDEEEERPR